MCIMSYTSIFDNLLPWCCLKSLAALNLSVVVFGMVGGRLGCLGLSFQVPLCKYSGTVAIPVLLCVVMVA